MKRDHFALLRAATGAAFALLFLAIAPAAFAQTITATITGTVTDQNGAVIPGATVTATSNETGLSKTDTTNAEGRYTIAFLNPGVYGLEVEKQGFQRIVRSNVKLEVAQTALLDFALAVGGTQEVVEVADTITPLLNTESAALETTIENKLIEDLPSAERSTLSFINLVPGAIDAGFAQARGETLNENANAQGPIGSPGNRNFFDSNFSVNGGRSSTNDILLDGVSNTVGDFNGVAVSPPQDSVREFKVQSGAYSAEYGRSGGGVVNFVTRAGGRKFHGALYEYFQDGNLNANGWQRNRRGLRRINELSRHQFGGAVGGPVWLPRFGEGGPIFRHDNRTFFFFNYEGRREDNPFTKELTLPTEKMRRGDLSELLTGAIRPGQTEASGQPALFGQIYNPFAPLAGGKREPVPGNRLDRLPVCQPGPRTAACLDPVALKVLSFLPLPTRPGLINNFDFSGTARFTRDIYAARIDKTISDRQNFFFRFSLEKRFQAEPNFFATVAANIRQVRDHFGNFTFNHIYSFSATVINNWRYGYTRVRAHQIPNSEGFDPTQLGLPSYLATTASALKFPDFNFAGGAGLPGEIASGNIGGAGNNQPRDTHTLADAVTWIRGNQTIKAGGEYRLYRFYAFQFFTPTGSFTFDRVWTRGPIPTQSPANLAEAGSSLASFLLGLPASGNKETVTPVTIFHHYGAGFIQDDWKARRNLTLNLGLRWDFETGTEETHGLITNFDLDAPSHLAGRIGAASDPFVRALRPNLAALRGILSFVNGPQTATNWNRFAPRFGFAYGVNDKMTIRGGYGIFFVPLSLEPTTAQGNNFTTSLVQSTQTGQVVQPGSSQSQTVFLTNPFPGGLPLAPGTSLGPDTLIGQDIFAVEPRRGNAYNQQWNLVLQRELARNLVIDVGYVGSRAVRLPIQTANLNQLPPAFLDFARTNFNQPGTCPTASNPQAACASVSQFFTQPVSNPFFGIITNPNSSLRLATVQRAQLLKPFPQYNTVSLFRPHWGMSNYHALQVNLQKRFSDGLSATANYTWSRLLDTGGVGNGAAFLDATAIEDIYDFAGEYSLSTLDVPHRFVAAWSYELPVGRGKRFGKGWGGFVNALLGGWQTSGSWTWQSGTPFPIVATNTLPIGAATRRPDRLPGNASLGKQARDNARRGGSWFDTNLFAVPADFTLGNAARTYTDVRRDTYKNVNLSFLKNWFWAEGRQKLQLRAEFLNVFNLVVFGTPGNNVNVAPNDQQTGFGQVRTQGNTPRIIQFVARYTF
jgi:hypothetical protein